MYLKRVDLVGFKSFATATGFTFEPGISVLCGPNGSGKSNVSDAVRWALGEQSARAIRGRRGEDVIFAGSQDRQPLGLAEVSLTLDNADGRIPLEYDEVRVTRRFYRSGEAEYLVNGSRVRLKDVHQWLLHAALDPDAYVVVGQGSVDELILQRPEERRAVVENAADTRRHHAKLAETRSKLAATDENLLRCRAVIAELEPHVKRLRSHAERAERYEACREELSRLAAAWFRHALGAAGAELEQVRREADSARTEADRLETALGQLEQSAARADLAALAAEEELASREPELLALRTEQARLTRELAIATERCRGARESQSRLERELSALGERATELDVEIAEHESRLVDGRRTLEDAERALAIPGADAQERALRYAEQALGELRRRAATAEVEVRSGRQALEEARRRLERAQQRSEEAAAERARLEAALASARGEAEARAAEAERCGAVADGLRRRRDEQLVARDEGRRALEALRVEQHRLAGEQQRLEIARRALDETVTAQGGSGVNVVLNADLAGVGRRGLLGGELQVPGHLRAAVSAALGESVRAILVETADGADAGLRLVQEQGVDRTTLVPLNGAAEAPSPDSILRFKAVARPLLADLPLHGFADELVACDPDLESVRTRYLALVVVAPDLPSAREAARRLSANGLAAGPWQVVTAAGQVIRWNGEWRAGRDQAGERLVGRRNDLAELTEQCRRADGELAVVVRQLAEAERRAAEDEARERQVREQLAAADAADSQAALAAQAAGEHIAGVERDARAAREAELTITEEVRRAAERLREARSRLDAAERDHATALVDLEQAERRAADGRAAWEASRTARAERVAELRATRLTVEAQAALLDRLRRDADDLGRAIASAEARLQSETEQVRVQAARCEELNGARIAAESQIEPLEEAVAAARARRRQATEERAGFERRAAELRAAARSQRTVLEAATIAEARAADRVERVRREAQDFVEELGFAEPGLRVRGWGLGDEDQPGLFGSPATKPQPLTTPLEDPEATRKRMNALRRELRAIGPVGESTMAEFAELWDRHAFLTTQTADLEVTATELRGAMEELEQHMRGAFDDAFARVNAAFGEYFSRLFGGGNAELVLSRPDDVLETGVDIVARPPGKRLQPLVSLSGGERALTMVALIFGLLKTNPAPFCVLDEVDAALDDSNVRRFTDVLQELSERTQFIVVTHNRATMEIAEALYGISMDTNGVSTVISLRLPREGSAGSKRIMSS